jgi:hypothetical protein
MVIIYHILFFLNFIFIAKNEIVRTFSDFYIVIPREGKESQNGLRNEDLIK